MPDNNNIGSTYIVAELDRCIANAEQSGDEVERMNFFVLKQIYLELRSVKKEVRGNPFFILGNFTKENPKLALTLGVVLIVLVNAWFVPVWLRPLLLLLNIPIEIP